MQNLNIPDLDSCSISSNSIIQQIDNGTYSGTKNMSTQTEENNTFKSIACQTEIQVETSEENVDEQFFILLKKLKKYL
jgi:hypothetical protein